MKVSIYKTEGGRLDVLVEAALGHGKAPVVLPNVTKEDLRSRLAPVLAAQKGRREARPPTT